MPVLGFFYIQSVVVFAWIPSRYFETRDSDASPKQCIAQMQKPKVHILSLNLLLALLDPRKINDKLSNDLVARQIL